MSISDVDRLIVELERGHGGEPWHGPSRRSVLADVTAVEALKKPEGGGHSIWELVLHMRAWTREVARRVRDGQWREPEEGDFPAVSETTPEAWRAAVAGLDVAHDELRAALRTLDPARLDNVVQGGGGDTLRQTLHGVAQHDAYHTGQIMVLKKIQRGGA